METKTKTLAQLIEAINAAKLNNVVSEAIAEDNDLTIYINNIDPYIMGEAFISASIDEDGDIHLTNCSEDRLTIDDWYDSIEGCIKALSVFDQLTGDREKDVEALSNEFNYIDYED